MNWALTSPRAPRASTIRSIVGDDERLIAVADRLRREHADRVAGMDAGPLDVLEEARDQHAFAIGDGVDVDLHALEVAVDADRTVGVHDGRGGQLAGQIRRRIAEVDGQAADDERRPDDDRVADPLGERQRLLDRVRHAAVRLRDAEPVEQRREARPLLRLVDRLEARAEQRDTAGGERRGQVERRLATVRDDGRQEVAVGRAIRHRSRSGRSPGRAARSRAGCSRRSRSRPSPGSS